MADRNIWGPRLPQPRTQQAGPDAITASALHRARKNHRQRLVAAETADSLTLHSFFAAASVIFGLKLRDEMNGARRPQPAISSRKLESDREAGHPGVLAGRGPVVDSGLPVMALTSFESPAASGQGPAQHPAPRRGSALCGGGGKPEIAKWWRNSLKNRGFGSQRLHGIEDRAAGVNWRLPGMNGAICPARVGHCG